MSGLRSITLCAAAAIAALMSAAASAWPQTLPRIASINVCTDQLLLQLADPGQIVGLSPYSRDGEQSFAAKEAGRFRRLSGEAEDVLMLKPDIVVSGSFTRRATREMLKAQGQRMAEFDTVRSIDDIRAQMARMGDLAGHPDHARVSISALDAAVARARATAMKPYRVLAVSRRGWVSGNDNLTHALMQATGLRNAAAEAGLPAGGFASLETIISLKPDLLLLSEPGDFAEDQGRAFLLHPALERLYPPDKRLVVPERLTVCGGAMFAEALDLLTAQLGKIGR